MARLSSHRWLHRVLGALSIYPLSAAVLRRLPLERRLGSGGARYRITSLDQLGIADEMFGRRVYAPALELGPIDSFVDLGCNAGWFAVWLASESPNPARAGLLVDANEFLVEEARWHITRNGLARHVAVHGAAGLPPGTRTAIFHVNPSASQSSLLEHEDDRQLPVKGRIRDVSVPAISVEDEWRAAFGDRRVDLLKLDIEGNELDFVRHEGGFLESRVQSILLEWHKWHVSITELDAALAGLGFQRTGTYSEDELTGVAVYRKR